MALLKEPDPKFELMINESLVKQTQEFLDAQAVLQDQINKVFGFNYPSQTHINSIALPLVWKDDATLTVY